jgi:hypothetical protein
MLSKLGVGICLCSRNLLAVAAASLREFCCARDACQRQKGLLQYAP